MLFPVRMILLAWKYNGNYHHDVLTIIKDKYYQHLLLGYRIMFVMGFVFYVWAIISLVLLAIFYILSGIMLNIRC